MADNKQARKWIKNRDIPFIKKAYPVNYQKYKYQHIHRNIDYTYRNFSFSGSAAIGTTVGKYIMAHPDKLQEYAVKFGTLLKTLNSTEADPKLYGDIKDIYRDRLQKAGEYFTDAENDILMKILDCVPDGSVMVHGDYHTNNVMVQSDGELVLIDMADISRGNSLFDFAGSYLVMNSGGGNDDNVSLQVIGLDCKSAAQVWDITLSTYFDTADHVKLGLIRNICGAFSLFRLAATPGMGTERTKAKAPVITATLRERFFPNADNFCKLFSMPL